MSLIIKSRIFLLTGTSASSVPVMAYLFSFLIVFVVLSLSSASPTNIERRMKKQVCYRSNFPVARLIKFSAVRLVLSPQSFKRFHNCHRLKCNFDPTRSWILISTSSRVELATLRKSRWILKNKQNCFKFLLILVWIAAMCCTISKT